MKDTVPALILLWRARGKVRERGRKREGQQTKEEKGGCRGEGGGGSGETLMLLHCALAFFL